MNVLRENTVTTRKTHRCWGCTQDIPVGSLVTVIVNVDSGRVGSTYWCATCMDFMGTRDYWDREDGWGYGEILDYVDYPKPAQEVKHE